MKKQLLPFALFLFLITQTKGQQYHPFPSNYGVWTYELFDDFHQPTSMFTSYVMQGDTTIGSFDYKKLLNGTYYEGALRENNKIIYFFPKDSTIEYVLYNFNLIVGDTIFNAYGSSANLFDTSLVVSVDSIQTNNGYYRILQLSQLAMWIEGIGSFNYFLQPTVNYSVSGEFQLVCFSNDSNTIYNYSPGYCVTGINEVKNIEQLFSLSPNPATNQLTIHASSFHNEAVTVLIVNVLGQETSPPKNLTPSPSPGGEGSATIYIGNLPAGIYFVQLTTEKERGVGKFVKE